MAWTEPGNQNNGDKNTDKQDPWRGKSREQGPPDLEKLLRSLRDKLKSNTKSKKSSPSFSPKPGLGAGKSFTLGAIIVVVAALAIWIMAGVFIVSPAERAVELLFGRYLRTVGPGPHWIPPFIETKEIVNVQKIDTYSYDSPMLTQDENIVSVAIAVQYRIDDVQAYLFNVVSPRNSLKQATASALRQVIGNSTLDEVLTTGREQIREQVAQQLRIIMDSYHAGILVTDVALQPAQAPEEVKAAFDDAIKAREDEQRYINQAQAYAMGVEPIARGQVSRILSAAKAYRQQIVLQAEANTATYLALLPIYERAPIVTRERMYLDAMQNILTNTSKILLDTPSNNLIYLPLDRMMGINSATDQDDDRDVMATSDSSQQQANGAKDTSDTQGAIANGDINRDFSYSRDDLSNLRSRDYFNRGAE